MPEFEALSRRHTFTGDSIIINWLGHHFSIRIYQSLPFTSLLSTMVLTLLFLFLLAFNLCVNFGPMLWKVAQHGNISYFGLFSLSLTRSTIVFCFFSPCKWPSIVIWIYKNTREIFKSIFHNDPSFSLPLMFRFYTIFPLNDSFWPN